MCVHFWLLPPPTYGEHIIGTCKYCNETRDFSILQTQDKGYKQICLAGTLTRPAVTMSTITAIKGYSANSEERVNGHTK